MNSLHFIYFTTIRKQVKQLILIMLVGTDVYVRMVFVWEETGVHGVMNFTLIAQYTFVSETYYIVIHISTIACFTRKL